jgi:hypothetical protein
MQKQCSTTSLPASKANSYANPGLEAGALAGVLHARRLEREQARRLDLGGHVSELELDCLENRDMMVAPSRWSSRITGRIPGLVPGRESAPTRSGRPAKRR